VIVLMVVALNLLNSVGADGSFGNENTDRSLLSAISRQLTPVFEPMGIREENWPALVGIFSGVLAKEVVVGTLDNLYTRLATDYKTESEVENFDLFDALQTASATVPENLGEIADALFDPLGLDIGVVDDPTAAAAAQSVDAGVFGAMATRFDGQAGAFAYLLFILLYMPCVATLGAVRREAGGPWTAFVALWTTGIAYISASIYYQSATFAAHPVSSTLWIAGLFAVLTAVIVGLRTWGGRGDAGVSPLRVAA
jgi:ferrous iron transport protein B